MGSTDESTSSKILAVLCQINARLEEMDRRLQFVQPSLPSLSQFSAATDDKGEIPISESKFRSFTTKQKVYPDGQVHLQEISIFGPDLLALLQGMSNPCPNLDDDTRQKKCMFPFADLVAHWDALSLLCKESTQTEPQFRSIVCPRNLRVDLREDISELLHCIEFAANCRSCIGERCANAERGLVRFEHLPSLFAPGALLSSAADADDQQVVEVLSCDTDSTSSSLRHCLVEYWHFRWTGEAFTKIGGRFQIEHYTGTKRIDGLPFRPLINSDASLADLKQAISKSELSLEVFKKLKNTAKGDYPLWHYDGKVFDDGNKTQSSDRVIVDPKAFSEHHKDKSTSEPTLGCHCPTCTAPFSIDDVSNTERHCLLVPTRVEGYLLKSRKWVSVPLRGLHGPSDQWELTIIDHVVVLDDAIKESLKLDILTYLEKRNRYYNESSDIIGHLPGLVLHFHGPRGVGKTLTAEALAEYSQRPLLFLSLAELGLGSSTFNRNLSETMNLSARWGAILVIAEADDLLQARSLHEDMARNALVATLLDRLNHFHGALILLTSHVSALDRALKAYVKQVAFRPLSADASARIFRFFLERAETENTEVEREILEWFQDVTTDWEASGREIRGLFVTAVDRASAKRRTLTLDDVIKAYTAMTGRRNDWDFVTESSLYVDLSQKEDQAAGRQTTQTLLHEFGTACSVPDDGRLPLAFSKSFFECRRPDPSSQLITRLSELTEALQQRHGDFHVVDWGWPRTRWCPQAGCVYQLRHQGSSASSPSETAQGRWKRAGFTFGLRRLLDEGGHNRGCGKPWRRLLLCQGLASVAGDVRGKGLMTSDNCRYLPVFPWVAINNACSDPPETPELFLHPLVRSITAHLGATPRRLQSPIGLGTLGKDDQGFHIVFYELLHLGEPPAGVASLPNMVPFYDRKSKFLRKSCFTMLHVPSGEDLPLPDVIHWTIVCLTPTNFWPSEETYAISESPSLRAQSLHYVAKALSVAAARWHDVLQELDELVDSGDALREPDRLQDILFDDNAFSISKRYFWAINVVHEIVNLLDDNIQKWALYQKTAVTPFRQTGCVPGEVEDWQEKAQATLRRADQEAADACTELKRLRQAFQEKLERITVMRDGLFNASAVMESRASTQLGENVKLLTFVSIFFLPWGSAWQAAIWSINESYSREALVIVTTLVALPTYFVTFNLNNLIRILHRAYAPRRRVLVEQMERDHKWSWLANRLKAFQRSEAGERRPSEWMVMAFALRQMALALAETVSGLFRLTGRRRQNGGDV
ncbi:uncharacterized protein Z518_07240 [Rhinocladiella mackenziei CBS 650.93]|uniref:AAA+ ATPase domain-containing protein n=1 Tax=Rhinocladiella mackenziei CBS 650.93 TaxID=1442369 RepID=A0A0D2FNN7_9EURO|nr:uncharacterized protein Z518_07240 [Rhinocladiella mackenziei CBS 650.93]KIX03687.1 hypothetical protein Z518_07240 [Rhinocladiella mackenziei CBS 650.93]